MFMPTLMETDKVLSMLLTFVVELRGIQTRLINRVQAIEILSFGTLKIN